ncbi:MAG TPA: ATP-binding cassette domain-containing protein [Chitinophagales bacterium]|nr:ATP-binding cassette domain-containing protein [Chitinophagales bacterium]
MTPVSVRNISKVFTVGEHKYNFKEFINENLSGIFSKNRTRENGEFYALKNVSFELEKGDVLGIIGDNGAGKTTLLKIISGVSQPSGGEVVLDGRLSSILEIGTGFHLDLTGRENIFLSGSILGMSRSEITSQYESIVHFSGLENFIHVPIKRYSSGMYLRLAFSVLAHLNTDIILLDEIIYVGDAEFRMKSYNKIKQLAASGKTIVIVSHDLASISELCSKCLLLVKGEAKLFGKTSEIVSEYLDESLRRYINTSNGENRNNKLKEELEHLQQEIEQKDKIIREKEAVLNSTSEKESMLQAELSKLKTEAEELYRIREAIKRGHGKEPAENTSFFQAREWENEYEAPGSDSVRLKKISIATSDQNRRVSQADDVVIEIEYWKYVDEPLCIGIAVSYNFSHMAFATSSSFGGAPPLNNRGKGLFKNYCYISRYLLNHGMFSFSLFFLNEEGDRVFSLLNAVFLKVERIPDQYKKYNYNVNLVSPFMPKLKWS